MFLPVISFYVFASFTDEGGHLRFTPKTPEAASFEKMAEIPVGNYTGTQNISIPLYTIEFGDIKIPISLDYLGTAIRVDQEASWVGLNWILNAGGAVTTQLSPSYDVSGVYPNEERRIWNYLLQTAPMTKMFCTGDYGQNIYYKIDGVHPDWSGGYGRNFFSYPSTIEDTLTYQGDLPKQIYNTVLSRGDGESPTYHACFLGNSISFIWDRLKKEFFIIGEAQVFSITGSYTSGINIIDGNGVTYEFHAIEWGQPEGANVDPSVARLDYTFYLSRIISPTGRTITFQYSQTGLTHPVYKVNEQLFDGSYPAQTLSDSYGQQGVLDLAGVGMNGASRVRTLSQYYTFHPIRLLSITTGDQIVKFVQSTQARRDIHGNDYSLQRIEIYRKLQDGTEELQKRFQFDYTYSAKSDVGGNTVKDLLQDTYNQWFLNDDFMHYRLMLNKVWEETVENGIVKKKPEYFFQYNAIPLPCKASAAVDFWGYYNGQENYNGTYHTLIPRGFGKATKDSANSFPDPCLIQNGADRRVSATHMQAGMLTGVRYPTGAVLSLEYEPHTFNNYNYYSYEKEDEEDLKYYTWKTYSFNLPNYTQGGKNNGKEESKFAIDKTGTYHLNFHFSKHDVLNKAYWRNLHCIIQLVKFADYDDLVEKNYAFELEPADTLGNQISIYKQISMQLEEGRYMMKIISHCPPSSHSTYLVESEISGDKQTQTFSNFNTYGYNTSGVIDFQTQQIYSSNIPAYQQYGEHTYKDVVDLTISTLSNYKISVSYVKNDAAKKSYWRHFLSCPLLLFKYNNNGQPTGSPMVFRLEPSDTTNTSNGVLRKEYTIELKKGQYKLQTGPLSSVPLSPNGLYWINTTISLENMATSSTEPKIESAGGGLRIKAIHSLIGNTQETTTYKYENSNGNTSGILNSPVVFARQKMLVYQSGKIQFVNGAQVPPPPVTRLKYWVAKGESMTVPVSPAVTYNRVIVSRSSDNQENGKSIYEYYNERWCSGAWYDYMQRIKDPLCGKQKTLSLYDSKNNLLRQFHHSYSMNCVESRLLNAVFDNIYIGPTNSTGGSLVSENAYADALNGGCMQIYLYPSVQFSLAKQTEKVCDFVDGHDRQYKTETVYNQTNHCESSITESTSRSGESIVMEKVYPVDYTNLSSATTLTNKHITDVPMEIVTTVSNSDGRYVTDANRFDYNSNGQLICKYTLNKPTILRSNFKLSNVQDSYSNYEKEADIVYNDAGQPRMVTEYGNKQTTYIWGYSNQYPIAIVEGVSASVVITALGGTNSVKTLEKSLVPTMSSDVLFNKLSNLSEALVTVYDYAPHTGVIKQISPNGETTTYDYDSFARLISVTDYQGVVSKTFQYHYKNE